MIRKILGNLIIGLLSPIFLKIVWLPEVYNALFKNEYKYYSFRIETLSEFLYHIYGENYILIYLLNLIVILLPFQLIKDYYFKMDKLIVFSKKVVIFFILFSSIVILFGCFSNIWFIPIWKNIYYILFGLFYSFIFSSLLYIVIDRYLERSHEDLIGKK